MSKATIQKAKPWNPFFSVIIPVHNRKKTVAQSIASVQNQTLKDVEIIVVDDASTDASKRIITKMQAKDSRIKTVFLPQNGGTHYARKKGVEQAVGEYVLFLDADDELEKHTLQKLQDNISQNHSDIVTFYFQTLGTNVDQAIANEIHEFFNRKVDTQQDTQLLQAVYAHTRDTSIPWNVTGKTFRTSLVKKGFELTSNEYLFYGEDAYELFAILNVKSKYRISTEEYPGYMYRIQTGISFKKSLGKQDFLSLLKGSEATLAAIRKLADRTSPSSEISLVRQQAYYNFAQHFMSDVISKWQNKLSKKHQQTTMPALLTAHEQAIIEQTFWRDLRNLGYSVWVSADTNIDIETLLRQAREYETYLDTKFARANTIANRQAFYCHATDIATRLVQSASRTQMLKITIPKISPTEAALPAASVHKDRLIVPIWLYNDLQTYTNLRVLITSPNVLKKDYFWDLFVLETGLSKRQKTQLIKNAPDNIRLTFITNPSGKNQKEIQETIRQYSPYPTYLTYGDIDILQHTHLVTEYLNKLYLSTPPLNQP